MDKKSGYSNADCFLVILQALLIAFKVANFIDWNWWQVLIPCYVEIFCIVVAVIIGIKMMEEKNDH